MVWIQRDLGLLKRDKKLQKRYSDWLLEIKEQYGSNGGFGWSPMRGGNWLLTLFIVNYLNTYRLHWGKPDTKSLLRSTFDDPISQMESETVATETKTTFVAEPPTHFTANIPEELISITLNDWPYSGVFSLRMRFSRT